MDRWIFIVRALPSMVTRIDLYPLKHRFRVLKTLLIFNPQSRNSVKNWLKKFTEKHNRKLYLEKKKCQITTQMLLFLCLAGCLAGSFFSLYTFNVATRKIRLRLLKSFISFRLLTVILAWISYFFPFLPTNLQLSSSTLADIIWNLSWLFGKTDSRVLISCLRVFKQAIWWLWTVQN